MPAFDHWRRIEQLFEEASALPPEDRTAFAERVCAGDTELLDRLLKLIENDLSAAADFLRPPAPNPRLAELLVPDSETLPPGTRLAGYKIETLIAHGGMGAVYLARQANPRRPVALKLLHTGLWSAAAIRRFEHEAQILARLEHPHIARIYEAGRATPTPERVDDTATTLQIPPPLVRPTPFFALEFVANASRIIEFATRHELDLRSRLDLFLKAADAVQFGHQRGIIHRDVKPANILVDGEGCVKVIDFGVARVVDSDIALTTMHTEKGQLIGTLAYMSPEQCDADPLGLDVRSDVYSLGVTLFELLCGRLPYEVSKTSIVAAARTIKETPPQRPSTATGSARRLAGRANRDLETIVLKALEKDRNKRYSSVADLTRDIRHFLDRESIEARPPTPWTRITRWAARHPFAATAALCIFIASVSLVATAAAIHYANNRPYTLAYVGHREGVALLSATGRQLHAWDGRTDASLTLADPRLHTDTDGHRLAIIGFTTQSAEFPGLVCAFDADHHDESAPIWSDGISVENEGPDWLRRQDRFRWSYGPCSLLLADIFTDKEHPGDELAVAFKNRASQCCVRVYDLQGKRLSEFWQDGGASELRWLSKANLLVIAGADEIQKERTGCFSPVVFAIRPELNSFADDSPIGVPLNLNIQPVWYKYLIPPIAPDRSWFVAVTWGDDTGAWPSDSHAPLNILIQATRNQELIGIVNTIIDSRGVEVPSAHATADLYDRNRSRLPDPRTFRLSNTPWSDLQGAAKSQPARPNSAHAPKTVRWNLHHTP